MPESNHKFTLGIMNKDADERIVRSGEYRDALNVQVATSDGGDVGALQNILGNTDASDSFINFGDKLGTITPLGDFEYFCVGSIVDGKTDRIYWLLAGKGKDIIAEYDYNTKVVSPIVVDIYNVNIVAGPGSGRVLNFDKNFLITGINIIDDFIFWTDNNTEPKQLSIKRSKLGSIDPVTNTPGFNYATDLYVKTRKKDNQVPPFIKVGKLREEHITVIKKSPKIAPRLEMKNTVRTDVDGDGFVGNINTTLTIAEPVATLQDPDFNWLTGTIAFTTETLADYSDGDFLVLTLNQITQNSLQQLSEIIIEIKGAIRYHDGSIPISATQSQTLPTTAIPGTSTGLWFNAEIVSGNMMINDDTNLFNVELKQSQSLFKFKFPRFASRYKYTDGQYSTFSPFSEVAFLPSKFDYLPKEGYNLGMVNAVRKLAVKDFVDKNQIPDDVVEIDILYKESNSPIVYTVDTIKRVDITANQFDVWNGVSATSTSTQNTTGFLNIKSEVVHAMVPTNQMLRAWDNVPRKALAQEIVGNRIVYGNYLQNYNMYNNSDVRATAFLPYGVARTRLHKNSNITVDVHVGYRSKEIVKTGGMVPELLNPFNAGAYSPAKSIKSLRTYQIGVSYIDEFGRETPVFSSSINSKNSIQINKATAQEAGRLHAQIQTTPPEWAKNFKFLIKESSNEYYNLAMDRFYAAQDGNIWLSFPSAERNKVDDETFLILKKRHESDEHVPDNTKYKILAIENEAPLFIKTKLTPKKTVFDEGFANPTTATMTRVVGTAAFGFNSESTGFPQPQGTNIIFDPDSIKSLTNLIEKEGTVNWQFRVKHAIGGTSKWYKIQSFEIDPITTRVKLVSRKRFGVDMNVTSAIDWIDDPAGAATSAFGDIQVEFAQMEVKNLPEFDGRFFVKVLADSTIKKAIIGETITGETDWLMTSSARSQYINPEVQYGARAVNDWDDGSAFGDKFFGVSEKYVSISELHLGNSNAKYNTIHDLVGPAGGGQSYWEMAANTPHVGSTSSGWFIDKIEAFRPWASTGKMGWNYGGSMDDSYATHIESGGSATFAMNTLHGTNNSGKNKQLKIWGTGTHSTITTAKNYLNTGNVKPPYNNATLQPMLQARHTYAHGGIIPSRGIDKTDSIIHLSYAGTGKDHGPSELDTLGQLKSHFGDTAWASSYVDEINFITTITTPGSLWRWREDPDRIIYRTTGWDPSMSMTQQEWNRNYSDSTDNEPGISLYNYTQFADYKTWHKTKYRAWSAVDGWYTAGNVHRSAFVSQGIGNHTHTQQWGGFAYYLLQDGSTILKLTHAVNDTSGSTTSGGWGSSNAHYKWPQFTEDWNKARNKRRRYMFAAKPYIDGNGEIADPATIGDWSTGIVNNDNSITGNYLPTNDPNAPSHFLKSNSSVLLNTAGYLNTQTTTPARPLTPAPGIRPDGVYSGYVNAASDTIPALKAFDSVTNSDSLAPGTCTFEVIEPYIENDEDGGFTTTNPAIWETEPKEDLDLDLYYEVGQVYPVELNKTNMEQFAGPIRDDKNLNTKVTCWMPPWGGNSSMWIPITTGATYEANMPAVIADPTLLGGIIPGSDDIRVVSYASPLVDFECSDGVSNTSTSCLFHSILGIPTGNTWESTDVGSDHHVWLEDINGVALIGDADSMNIYPNQVAPPFKSRLIFTREDGSKTESTVGPQAEYTGWTTTISNTGVVVNNPPVLYNAYELEEDTHNYEITLPWYNCYSFGNGVESNRVRDDYNQVFIDKGARVSTVLEEPYLEDRRSSGLIYSGIYNSISNVNNLNQFIQAEKITKDLNPDGGSIQKLYTRDTNLMTICEDKVFKILAQKDALFNADGNPQLVATDKVLGEATTFAGDYGISTNPESFAVDSFRAYFTDRVRGSVIRLSMDGITPISAIGMTDWFNDNLVKAKRLIGSFDDKKKEYNLNLGYFDYTTYSVNILCNLRQSLTSQPFSNGGGPPPPPVPLIYTVVAPGILILNGTDASNFFVGDIVSGQGILPGSVITDKEYKGGGTWWLKLNQKPLIDDMWALLPEGRTYPYPYGEMQMNGDQGYTFPTRITASVETQPSSTLSFSEKNKGWVSFKSFLKEGGLSLNNEYFTFKEGMLWQHHTNPIHNNFYNEQFDSSVEVLFNELPGSVKSFGSLSYEGSQSHITQDLQNSGEYWDNKNKLGWYVSNLYTDMQEGNLHEFKDKENKWFSQIKGVTTKWLDDGKSGNIDTNEFSYQGIDDNNGVNIIDGDYTSWECSKDTLSYPGCLNINQAAKDVNNNLYKHYDAAAVAATGNTVLQNPSWINYVWMNSANPGGVALSNGQQNGAWTSGYTIGYTGTPGTGQNHDDNSTYIFMGTPTGAHPCWVNGIDNEDGHYRRHGGTAITSPACLSGNPSQPLTYAGNFNYLWYLGLGPSPTGTCGFQNLVTSSGQPIMDAFGDGNLVWNLEYDANGASIFGPNIDGITNIMDAAGMTWDYHLGCKASCPQDSVVTKCKEISGLGGSYADEIECLSDTLSPCGALCTYPVDITVHPTDATSGDCDDGSVHVNLSALDLTATYWNITYEAGSNVTNVPTGAIFDDPTTYYFFGDSNSFTLPGDGDWSVTVTDSNGCFVQQAFVIDCVIIPSVVPCTTSASITLNIVDATEDGSCPTSFFDGEINVLVNSLSLGATFWTAEYFAVVNNVNTSIYIDDNSGSNYYSNDTSTLQSVQAGDYMVSITDDLGCTTNEYFFVYCMDTASCSTHPFDFSILNPVNPTTMASMGVLTASSCANGTLDVSITGLDSSYTGLGLTAPTQLQVDIVQIGGSTHYSQLFTPSDFPINFTQVYLPEGTYELRILDSNGCSEVRTVTLVCQILESWNCHTFQSPQSGTGNTTSTCIDPGDGSGLYSALSICQAACYVPSWDCSGDGGSPAFTCFDPGTGNGQYATLIACQNACVPPQATSCANNLYYLDNGPNTHAIGTAYTAGMGMSNPSGKQNYLKAMNDYHEVIINFNGSNLDPSGNSTNFDPPDCNNHWDPYFRREVFNFNNGGGISVEIPKDGLNNGPQGSKNNLLTTAATTCRVWLEAGLGTDIYHQNLNPIEGCHYETSPGVINNSCSPYVNFRRQGLVKTPLAPYNITSMQDKWYGDYANYNGFSTSVLGAGYQNSDCDFFGLLIKGASLDPINTSSPALHGNWKVYLEDDRGRIFCWKIQVPCGAAQPIGPQPLIIPLNEGQTLQSFTNKKKTGIKKYLN